MRSNDIFESKYVKTEDLQGRTVTVTIERVEMKTFDEKERKPVVFFAGRSKGLVLNRTNFASIVELTGQEDTDNWPGYKIALVPTKVDFQGKRVPAIRIDAPAIPASTADHTRTGPVAAPRPVVQRQVAPSPAPVDDDVVPPITDDDIPF